MGSKQLIIKLIQQDLKHCQLVYGLDRVGLDVNDKYHLQIMDIIYDLMKVPQSIELDWGIIYQNYMKKGVILSVKNTDICLKSLSELCYKHLKTVVDCEKKQLRCK